MVSCNDDHFMRRLLGTTHDCRVQTREKGKIFPTDQVYYYY